MTDEELNYYKYRYKEIRTPYRRALEMVDADFTLVGDFHREAVLVFRGLPIMRIIPEHLYHTTRRSRGVSEGEDIDLVMVLDILWIRRIKEEERLFVVDKLDKVFSYGLIKKGLVEASEYIQYLNEKEIEDLLDYSIMENNHSLTATVLDVREKMNKSEDLSLGW